MEKVELSGVSVAGVETCIEVPGLHLLLDLGACPRSAVSQPVVLLSHGHLDHMGAIANHAARRALLGMSAGVYVVPRAIAADVEALFNAAGALDGQAIPRRVVPLAPGEEYALGKGRVADYTWAQVMGEARRMAAHLRSRGFGPGARIANRPSASGCR